MSCNSKNSIILVHCANYLCKKGMCISDYFSISNGVRQGGILPPKIIFVYVDDLSDKIVKSKVY